LARGRVRRVKFVDVKWGIRMTVLITPNVTTQRTQKLDNASSKPLFPIPHNTISPIPSTGAPFPTKLSEVAPLLLDSAASGAPPSAKHNERAS
jgi:hypothetical protein